MTAVLYQDWLREWDRELMANKRKILLLQDNFSGHIVPDGLQNIQVKNFKPNLTAHVQPKDHGIIRCFKAHYRSTYIQCSINHYDSGVTPSEIYDINQLQAMRLANAAWHEVDTTTIRHCWHKAGILPPMDSPPTSNQPSVPISSLINDQGFLGNPIAHIEKEVEAALDELVSTGALQTGNRMDIDTLLNPETERCVMDETTDEEIFEAVMESRRAEENGPMNSGDDDVDDDACVEARPTRHEAMQAASVMKRYIDDLDDPFARKLEAILGSFGRQMRLDEARSMVPTQMTDYFTRP